jgi:hypothetical protein
MLATKQDLEMLKLAVRQDVGILRQEMEGRFKLIDQKFETIELRLFVKLGSLSIAGFGLVLTAKRFWA